VTARFAKFAKSRRRMRDALELIDRYGGTLLALEGPS
jgi:hypothetical protein